MHCGREATAGVRGAVGRVLGTAIADTVIVHKEAHHEQ
jgi:hypothetical protein